MAATPTFKIIQKKEATTRRKPRRERMSWIELVNEIADTAVTKKAVFVSDNEVDDADVKYLTLAMKRRGKNEFLRTQREVVDGIEGRLLWAEIA